jgi:hypothetical protein
MDGDNNQGDVPLLLEEDGEKHTSVFDDDDDDDDDSLDSDAVHRISKSNRVQVRTLDDCPTGRTRGHCHSIIQHHHSLETYLLLFLFL